MTNVLGDVRFQSGFGKAPEEVRLSINTGRNRSILHFDYRLRSCQLWAGDSVTRLFHWTGSACLQETLFCSWNSFFSRFSIASLANRPRPGRVRGDQSSSETRMKRNHRMDGEFRMQRSAPLSASEHKTERGKLSRLDRMRQEASGFGRIFGAGSKANSINWTGRRALEISSVCFYFVRSFKFDSMIIDR